MKKSFVFMLIMLGLLTLTEHYGSSITTNLSNLKENAKVLASSSDPYCYSGGRSASRCSVNAGTEIAGFGVSGGCSVACREGSYACCTIRCECVLERKSTNEGPIPV